ncbi:SDR family oxidoreductase [candidate division KSB1 bacterium]|nr:MAG: SDR family oxidoreductase [candidate division KSB1 bacterium]
MTETVAIGGERILLTGATGYVGGRLLHTLESRGYLVRCLARNPEWLASRVGNRTEVVRGDVRDADSLQRAMTGITTAFYLVHALTAAKGFEQEEFEGAQRFANAARDAGVRRIIYLGGLGSGKDLSPHLKTRHRVGELLRESGVQVIEFRAGMIIGSGSISFEILRALVGRLPVMTTPSWTETLTQPIAIEDVLSYLMDAVVLNSNDNEVIEIGGPDRITYKNLLREYAQLKGFRRWIVPVPVLSPRVSSLWLGLVTPVYARVGRKLIEGLRNETTANTERALSLFSVRPMSTRQAMQRALTNEEHEIAQTRWSDAYSAGSKDTRDTRFGSRIIDSRHIVVACRPSQAFVPIRSIGGNVGWYYLNWLWKLRGWLDLLAGGVGMRRGRRDTEQLLPGDALDFWRVEAIENDSLLRLKAEMKLPGRAWLQFEVKLIDDTHSAIYSTAIFDPVGLMGLLYWYLLYPVHVMMFRGMLRKLAEAAINPKKQ